MIAEICQIVLDRFGMPAELALSIYLNVLHQQN